MNPREDIAYWKKRKTEVERAAKIVSQKREKTLYLYEVEKQSRRKARELQLRTLLEYETKELQQTQAGLQKINAKIIELEREQQKHSNVRMIGLLSLFIILFTFAGLVVYHHDGGNNALTGAVVGVQPEIDTHCHEEITCINETITTCTNETVQQCDSSCVNETKQTCVEECKPECHPEEINGVEREVCVKRCSEVCTEEVVQNCGSCAEVVGEKCSSEVIEECSTKTVCDEFLDSGVGGDINAGIVEDSSAVGIQPIVEEPIEVPGSEELDVQPIEEEIPDDMTGGAIAIPEPALGVPSVEESAESEIQSIVEERHFIGIREIIISAPPTLTSLVLNTTNYATNDTNVNLTAHNVSNNGKIIYNWLVNGSTIEVLNMPFEGINNTATNNAWDYSGLVNNGSEIGQSKVGSLPVWNSTGGHDGKGAYKFFGLTGFINITDKGNLEGMSELTVSLWFNSINNPSSTSIRSIIAKGSYVGDNSYFIRLRGTEGIRFGIMNGSQSQDQVDTIFLPTTNRYYHAAMTWKSGGNLQVYINGTFFRNGSTNISGTIRNSAQPLKIGSSGFATDLNFSGHIDEITIWNKSLSAEQIYALWRNQTNVIVAQETNRGENWTVIGTPNDGSIDGLAIRSNNVTILNAKPTISTLVLNSTNITSNNTNVNLTAYSTTADADGDSLKVIYNWLKAGSPIAVLNMPFEGINRTTYNNSWDYSGLGNNGNETNAIKWNATAGYDGKGAYDFKKESSNYINLGDRDAFKNVCNNGCTFGAWIYKKANSGGAAAPIIARFDANGENRFFRFRATGQDRGIVLEIYANGSSSPSCSKESIFLSDDTWNHVVGRYNLTHVAMFVNGTEPTAAATCSFSSINTTAWQDAEPTYIGRAATNFVYFNGTIDEVMIWNRSLSAEQIYALWRNQTNVIVAQETAVGENWTVQATPNDGYEDGIMNTSSNVTILNTKPVVSTLVLNTTNITSNNTNVNLTAYSTTADADGDSLKVIYNWLVDRTSIAVLNMPFEGINRTTYNNSRDYSGYGNNGNESGGIVWNATGGYDGKGAYMFGGTGTSQYIDLGDRDHFKSSLCINGCTFSAWAYKRDATSNVIILSRNDATGNDRMFRIGVDGNERVDFGITSNGSSVSAENCAANSATGQFLINVWQHVTGRYNLTHTALFINGTQVGATACPFPGINVSKWDESEKTFIGAREDSVPTQFWNGTIDEVTIFNRSLSSEQIYALWRNQTNVIVAQETSRSENWTVQATPNDGYDDGAMVTSNNVTILNTKPAISTLVLNSTNLRANHTGTNLIAYPASTDADSDSVKVIYNWLRNDTPIALLNMPFERINGTDIDNAFDYSGYQHNGSVVGATWNATAGFDGKGAYLFDDNGDYIEMTQHLSRLEGLSAGTISLWYRSNDSTTNGDYLFSITDKDVSTDVMIFSVGSSTGAYTDEGLNFVNIRGSTTVLSMFVREGETRYKDKQWHHLAVVTGDGDNRMYIDGVRKPLTFGAGSAATKEFSNINNPDKSFIGRYHVGGTAFDSAGVRDEVLIFNRSLSEEQIVAIFNNRTDKIVSRELRVGENWTVEATPNDGQEDGAVVTSNNITILANTLPSITSLVLNSTIPYLNSTNQNLTAYANKTDSNNDSVKIIYDWLRDGDSVAFLNMPFERINDTNTNNARDYSINSNNGTISGATWVEDAGYDSKGAYTFDGINDFIASVGNVSDFSFMQNTGNFTIEAWIKFNNYTANSLQVIAGNTPTTGEKGFLFTYENRTGGLGHNHLTLALYRGVAATYTVWANSSDFKIIDNDWHHVAAVGNYTNVLFYVDGVYDTGSVGAIINKPTGSATRVLDLGRYNGATPAGYFNGTIDELRIWEKTLSAQQIFAIFKNKTEVIVFNETKAGENWTVDATPNDGVEDGAVVRSNQVIISGLTNAKPVLTSLVLNTTNVRLNDTSVNLTVYAAITDADGDAVKNITNWKLYGLPFAAINLPFELDGIMNGTDYGGFENNISSISGAVFLSSGGYGGKGAYNFSPADDVVNLNTTNFPVIGTGPYTVEAWIKAENGASHAYQTIFSVNNFDPAFYVTGTSGLRVFDGADINSATTTTITNANWHHVAFVRAGTTVTFYLDGASYGTGAHSAEFPAVTNLRVGWDGQANEDFHGTIDELKVYNYSLTAQQINAHFNNKTTTIVSQQLADAQVWSVEITPHDGIEEGTRVSSNNVTIQNPPVVNITVPTNHSVFSSGSLKLNFTVTDGSAISNCWYSINNGINTSFSCVNQTIYPGKGAHNITIYANDTINLVGRTVAGNITVGAIPNISALVLNTTNLATNDTSVNLTAYPTVNEGDSDSYKVIYNWYRNDTPLMVLNLPFEQINGTNTSNTKDYTGLNPADKFTENGGVFWNQTGGHDTKGAYVFDGSNDFIQISNASIFDLKNFTFVAWIRANAPAGFQTVLDVDNDKQFLGLNGAEYEVFGRCGANAHGTVKTGILTMLSWSVNGSTYQLYENTTVIGTGSLCSGGVDGDMLNIGAGATSIGGAGNELFIGTIDDIKIFNISLTAEQISALYYNRTSEIASSMTKVGDNWTVRATPNDGYDDGAIFISNNVTIRAAAAAANTAPPAPVLVSPANLTTTTSRTPTFIWNNSVDTDSDPNISYRLIIDDSIVFNNPEVDVSGILNTTNDNTTYTISTELAVDTTYFWHVAAYDQTVYGDNSSTRNFTVQSYLAINITDKTVAFGTLPAGANVSTPNNASPLRAENVGNIIANITVTGTPLFTAVSIPSTFYRFRIRANESGAFNTTASATEWNETNTTLGVNIFHVINLDWHSISNDFLTDLNISVPLNESAGSKISTITFTITG